MFFLNIRLFSILFSINDQHFFICRITNRAVLLGSHHFIHQIHIYQDLMEHRNIHIPPTLVRVDLPLVRIMTKDMSFSM